MEQSGKRITVGLLVSGIMDKYTESVCKGVMQAAKKADVNLVVLPCKYLDRDLTEKKEIMYEYQYNTLFSYARKDNLDALLISADSIGCYTSRERIQEVLEQYQGIPSVLIASKIDGYVSVNYDNYAGIKEGLEYLIQRLGCKKIGMIGGPDDNSDAYERKQAFMEVLNENGIIAEEKNYVEGNLSRYRTSVFQEFLDNNPDAEAVFCVNDDTALGFCDEMKVRKLVPGKDIYVFGYDDTLLAEKSKPSLSSVRADAAELGKKAFEIVLRMLSGERAISTVLPTKFIRRDSFGESEKRDNGTEKPELIHIAEYFEDIFYRCKYESSAEELMMLHSSYHSMMEKVFLLYERYETEKTLVEDVLNLMDEFLSRGALEYADIDRFMLQIEWMRQTMQEKALSQEDRQCLRKMFNSIYRKIVNAMDCRFGVMKEEEESNHYSMKLFVRDIMQFEKGSDQSYMVLLEHLNWLDIKNGYIYLFEKPMMHLHKESFSLPKHMYLKAVLEDGKVRGIPVTRQRKRISDIYHNTDIVSERYSLVLLPLFSNEFVYGVILCDLTEKMFDNGEFLVNQMGSAVKMIELLRANGKIQQKLEESLVTLRENNIALDNLSKSDSLTGILNRRGFQDTAEKFLDKNRQAVRQTLVAYVDMNNLKIINDRYGHEDGDFSLKVIGDMLVDVVGKNGIAGRIGGDEFACIMKYEPEDEGKKLLDEIQKKFLCFNAGSDKPYNITVSVGTYVVKAAETISLKEALALADERLYEAKQYRVKTVAKQEEQA